MTSQQSQRKAHSNLLIKNTNALLKRQIQNVARKKGYTLSSYIRRLIREDLDRQSEDYKRDILPDDDGC